VPLQTDFLGGGHSTYITRPTLWAWLNFDGEHYFSLVRRGYQPLKYFYFPLYPIVVWFMTKIFGAKFIAKAVIGLLVSNISFVISLVGLWRLVKLDFNDSVVFRTLMLLLVFPTSFYFGSFYTESFFLALAVWSFYSARRGRWLTAGILGGLANATRIFGLALIPAFLVEIWLQKIKDKKFKIVLPLISTAIASLGFLLYVLYLKIETGDPLAFFHSLRVVFGEQRSDHLIFVPQVFYRYIFKVLPNVNYDYLPAVFTAWLEFLSALMFGGFGVLGILGILGKLKRFGKWGKIKYRESYVVYLIAGYLIPTFSGSFSSVPRYYLVLFPAFIWTAAVISKASRTIQFLVYFLLSVGLVVATMLYTRGYWVS
jgi:hypothetical protein